VQVALVEPAPIELGQRVTWEVGTGAATGATGDTDKK